jgi:hypothetical protein
MTFLCSTQNSFHFLVIDDQDFYYSRETVFAILHALNNCGLILLKVKRKVLIMLKRLSFVKYERKMISCFYFETNFKETQQKIH